MSSSESDIEMKSALPKKTKKKIPKSPSEEMLKKNPEPKKLSTKDMINQALSDLKTRKGTSLYAIKKYLTEKHNVNVDKINYIIKKNIKTGIEEGTIVQTKGVGASGSFKLAPKKKPDPSDPPKKKKVVKKTDKGEVKKTKAKKSSENADQTEKKMVKKKIEKTDAKGSKVMKKKVEKTKEIDEKSKKITKSKMAKEKQTPAKKRANMMKRKSIGSIIKPPKMKPKAR